MRLAIGVRNVFAPPRAVLERVLRATIIAHAVHPTDRDASTAYARWLLAQEQRHARGRIGGQEDGR